MILAKPQNLFSTYPTSNEAKVAANAPVETKSGTAPRAKKKAIAPATGADLATMIAQANAQIGAGALALEKTGEGAEVLTLQASTILLIDKKRPRISLAASEIVQPVLSSFVNSMRERKEIVIEASSDIPASYVRPLEKYLRSYKGWGISKIEPETAGVFRVRIQEAK